VEPTSRLAGRQKGSFKSLLAALVAALEVSKGVLEPVPCLDPPKELAASCACIQGSSDLFKICLVQRINLLTLPHTLVDHRAPLEEALVWLGVEWGGRVVGVR
jgi:hypothetical protein